MFRVSRKFDCSHARGTARADDKERGRGERETEREEEGATKWKSATISQRIESHPVRNGHWNGRTWTDSPFPIPFVRWCFANHFPLFRPRFSVFTLPREGCLLAIFLGYREWESRLRYRRIFLIDIKWKGNETGHIRNGTGYKGEKKETRRELKEIISMSLITVIKMIHVIFKLASLVYLQHTYFNIFLIKWSLSVRVLATLWNVKINIVIWNIN